MSASFAYAQIGGIVGQDPEAKSLPGGTKVTNFSVAVEQGYGDSKSTGWHDIVAFGEMALWAEKYVKKGSSVKILGTIQIRSWDDKQTGSKRYKQEVVAHKIDFGAGTKSGDRQTPAPRQASTATRQQAAPAVRSTAPVNDPNPFDDDLGF